MMIRATLALVAVLGIASPVLAQSWDPDVGTGNLVAINNGVATQHSIAAKSGRNAFAMVPGGGMAGSGYEDLLKTH